jgi:hypothetical protein
MAPGQVSRVLFDQAGLGQGKVGGRGIGKSAAVWGLERETSFGEVRAPYLQATAATSIAIVRTEVYRDSKGIYIRQHMFAVHH